MWFPTILARFADEAAPIQTSLARRVVDYAREELGRGESHRDNDGADVRRYARTMTSPGNWCAAFVCWCIEEAAKSLHLAPPVRRTHGAKALWRAVLAAGGRAELPMPGDVVCWHRGPVGAWTGHVGIVSRVDGEAFWSIEGNRGRYPSKVREFGHELGEDRLLGFARLP